MRLTTLLAAAAFSLSACATTRTAGVADPLSAAAGERITYETSACYGTCPVYSVTVDTASGAGEFVGTQHTAVTGARRFQATPAQVASFRNAVSALRATPVGAVEPGGAACATYATDMPGVTVIWEGANGTRMVRRVDYGCDGLAHRAMFDGLRSVPKLLPIAALIGK